MLEHKIAEAVAEINASDAAISKLITELEEKLVAARLNVELRLGFERWFMEWKKVNKIWRLVLSDVRTSKPLNDWDRETKARVTSDFIPHFVNEIGNVLREKNKTREASMTSLRSAIGHITASEPATGGGPCKS